MGMSSPRDLSPRDLSPRDRREPLAPLRLEDHVGVTRIKRGDEGDLSYNKIGPGRPPLFDGEPTVTLGPIRVPTRWGRTIDKLVEHLSRVEGKRLSKAEVMRRALVIGLRQMNATRKAHVAGGKDGD